LHFTGTLSMPDRSSSRSTSRLNRWLGLALVVSTLALLGWLGWRAVRTGLYARAALDDLDRLQAVMAKPSLSALPQAQTDLASLQTHLIEAQAAGRPFLSIAPAFGWTPRWGPDLVAAPHLVEMTVEVATAGRVASDALAPVGQLLEDGGGLDALPKALEMLVAAQPALAEAGDRLERAAEIRAALPPLSEPRLLRQLDKVDRLLPLAQEALALAEAAPALLGADRPRTYLLLAQNSDELRATGGFISGAGHVTIDRGKLTDLVLTDSYAVDNWEQPHPEPPAALRKYMAADLWVLRDSNWSPDFPTAADVARALYAQDRGVETDGAIALDLEAVRSLVGAVGPLQVPSIAEPVTGENALSWMKTAWESPAGGSTDAGTGGTEWWKKRKDFMGEIVKAALAKVEAGADFDPVAMARALYGGLDTRHIQVAVDDPTLAPLLAERGWDGGVRPPASSDFLFVVDSNVGFNKANQFVRQALDYTVRKGGGGLEATLTISYTHTAPATADLVCDRNAYGPNYQDLAARCYWDFVRVYVPGGSELLASDGLNGVTVEPGERGTAVLTGDLVLQPGKDHVVTLRYRLPGATPTQPYRLYARKQAGTPGWPLAIRFGDCHEETTLTTDFRFQCPPAGTAQ
jgi:hypothetical protein